MRILITDHLHPDLAPMLESAGFVCDVQPDITNEEILVSLNGYQGLIVATKIKVTEALLQAAPGLRFVARAGSGMENIDQVAAARLKVHCISSPEGNADAVAEHAIGMILALLNHLPRADREIREGLFRREANRGRELGGKTLGIIGFGHTGSALAAKLQGFGMQLLAYDKYKTGFATPYCRESTLQHLYEESDFVSLHLPLTPETQYFLNQERISQFRKPFYLINTSRGSVVNTADLIQALQDGKITGAALDVFENEKPETYGPSEVLWWNPLKVMDQVLLSPHIAGLTQESKYKIAKVMVSKISALGLLG